MGKYTPIKEISLPKLNNREYTNHMNWFIDFCFPKTQTEEPDDGGSPGTVSAGNPELGLTEEDRSAFMKDLELLRDLVDHSRIQSQTKRMSTLDVERDDLSVYFTSVVTQLKKSPITAQRDSATEIYNVVKPYIGLYKQPNLQKTVSIHGMLLDLGRGDMPTHLETLGLTEVIERLKEINETYDELAKQRVADKANLAREKSASIRERLDEMYTDMVLMAQSQSIVNPSATSETFVTNMNNLVDNTRSLYNLRIAMLKNGEKEGEGEGETTEGGEKAKKTKKAATAKASKKTSAKKSAKAKNAEENTAEAQPQAPTEATAQAAQAPTAAEAPARPTTDAPAQEPQAPASDAATPAKEA